jgi:hypothetical protein
LLVVGSYWETSCLQCLHGETTFEGKFCISLGSISSPTPSQFLHCRLWSSVHVFTWVPIRTPKTPAKNGSWSGKISGIHWFPTNKRMKMAPGHHPPDFTHVAHWQWFCAEELLIIRASGEVLLIVACIAADILLVVSCRRWNFSGCRNLSVVHPKVS